MSLRPKGSAAVRASASPPRRSAAELPAAVPVKRRRERWDQMRAFERWVMKLKPREVAAFIVCWNSAPADGRPFHLSHDTIAKRVNIRRENAVRVMGALCRHGLLMLVRRGCSYTKRANEYRMPTVLPMPPD